MSKRFIIIAAAIVVMGTGLAAYLSYISQENHRGASAMSKAELAAKYADVASQLGQTNVATEAVLTPIALSHPVRLAIGGLGLTNNDQNQRLGDLVTVQLTGTPGFELVERQKLAAILQELNLSLNRFVRAKDAVRAGKLLRADWFLLGTAAKIDGTNSLVVRMVDGRTGIMRDAGVFPADQPLTELATSLSGFLRQSRQDAATAKLRVYLAVGAFEDLSVNNRRADFPAQLSGYLTAAYRGSRVTLLERDYVDTLLQEVRLDLAGLTENNGTNPPSVMQSAFWLVSGQYQSYETTNLQVEVNLEIQRIFGRFWHRTLRGLPGDTIGQQVKSAIDDIMRQNASSITPTPASEVRIQMSIGRELARPHDDHGLVMISSHEFGNSRSEQQMAEKQKRRLEDAVRTFKTVLLIEPNNHEAKMYLAACMRNMLMLHPDVACNYYREIIDDPVQDKWTGLAERALIETFLWFGPDEKFRWLQSAASGTTNQIASTFYQQQAGEAEQDITINAGDSPKAEELAEKRLFECIQSAEDYFHGKLGSVFIGDFGMGDYLAVFGGDGVKAIKKLAALLPKMKKLAPDLEPYLVTTVLTFQLDANTPVIKNYQAVLANCVEHPHQVPNPRQFWADTGSVFYWCFEKTNYPLAVQIMEDKRSASAEGDSDFNVRDKINLAYAYLAVERWRDALDIFESFNNRPVQATAPGPWEKESAMILTDKMAAFCRQKIGQATTRDARLFDLGKPVLCLCSPSTFVADDNGLWVGIGGHLLQLGFDLKTNLSVKLPMDDSVPVTAICPGPSKIWIGTEGAGLIEYDKPGRQCRRLTEADGLMMDSIASLALTSDSLWIGYGGATGGGLGQLDLRSQKLNSFMPSLSANLTAATEEMPPRAGIQTIVADAGGEIWMLTKNTIRQFQATDGIWKTVPRQLGWIGCFSADKEHLIEGGGIAPSYLADGTKPKGSLAIQSLRDHHWQKLDDADGVPYPPTTMTLNGNDLWLSGEGFIALVDLTDGKVRKFCHIQAERVDRLQVGGGYLWAQFDWHLYRVPLSALQ